MDDQSNQSKPREWWVDLGINELVPETCMPSKFDIHVIEYSAYEKLQQDLVVMTEKAIDLQKLCSELLDQIFKAKGIK